MSSPVSSTSNSAAFSSEPRLARRLDDERRAALDRPAEDDLRGRAPEPLGDRRDGRLLDDRLVALRHVELDVGQRAERREGGDRDVLLAAEAQEILGQVGVGLDLQHGGRDARVVHQVAKERDGVVADADLPHELARDERLHRVPGLLERHVRLAHDGRVALRIVHPLGRVARLERHVGERDREVHEVEIEVVETEVLERALSSAGRTCSFPWKVFQSLDVIQSSSRVQSPSSSARRMPSPTSRSLP